MISSLVTLYSHPSIFTSLVSSFCLMLLMKLSGSSPWFFGRTENLSYPDLTLYIIPRNLWCCQDLRWHTSDLFRTDTTLISTWGNVKSFSFNSGKWRICRRRSMRASAHPRRKKEKKTIRKKERIGRFLSNWIRQMFKWGGFWSGIIIRILKMSTTLCLFQDNFLHNVIFVMCLLSWDCWINA